MNAFVRRFLCDKCNHFCQTRTQAISPFCPHLNSPDALWVCVWRKYRIALFVSWSGFAMFLLLWKIGVIFGLSADRKVVVYKTNKRTNRFTALAYSERFIAYFW